MRLLMLARSAMLSTLAPSYPLSVNSFTAATRIAALVDSGSRVFPVRMGFSRGRPELASILDLPVGRIFGPLAGNLAIVIILGLNEPNSTYLTTPPASCIALIRAHSAIFQSRDVVKPVNSQANHNPAAGVDSAA